MNLFLFQRNHRNIVDRWRSVVIRDISCRKFKEKDIRALSYRRILQEIKENHGKFSNTITTGIRLVSRKIILEHFNTLSEICGGSPAVQSLNFDVEICGGPPAVQSLNFDVDLVL